MKAIVFGGSGFLGSHVADSLTQNGYEVTIYDIVKSTHLKEGQEMVAGDLLEIQKVQDVCQGASVVYNFAGLADIDEASEKPIDTIKNNILGNCYVLEALKVQEIKRYVFASTIYVYSQAGSFYKSSKLASELYIEDYNRKYGIPYTVLRYGSLYGPRSNENNPLYRLLMNALDTGVVSHYGTGEEVREYIHVEDAARCSVEILDEKFKNQNVLITGHHPVRSKELVTMIKEILGAKYSVEFRKEEPEAHYEITPYSFNPRIGRKYVSSYYLDMGQGLLQLMEELHRKNHKD